MDENEVKEAIEAGNVPMDVFVKIMLIFNSACVVFMLILAVKSYIHYGLPMMLFAFIILIPIIVLIYWQCFLIRKLTPYLSTVSLDKKTDVLERILSEYNSNYDDDDREDSIYKFTIIEKGYFGNWYSVTIIYNEFGYYINCNISVGKMRDISTGKTNEIIKKIKKLEAEL